MSHHDNVIRGVLFDLFGTVVAPFSRERHRRMLGQAATALGLDPVRCERIWEGDYRQRVLGRSGSIAQQLTAIAAIEGRDIDQATLDRVVTEYAQACDGLMVPAPTARAALAALSKRGVPVGLVSNTAPDFAAAFERSPLRSLVRTRIYSCAVGVAKPDPDIYRKAAAALGIRPGDLLFVGDGSDDELEGAAAAGLVPALVEVDATDTYDPERASLECWSGRTLRHLHDVLSLVP